MRKIKVVSVEHLGSRWRGLYISLDDMNNYLDGHFVSEQEGYDFLFNICEAGYYYDPEKHEIVEDY